MKRRFEVELIGTAVIEFDEELMPDEKWRKHMFPIHTLSELAEHLGYNMVVNGLRLSSIDGFADRDDHQCVLVECPMWGVEAREV